MKISGVELSELKNLSLQKQKRFNKVAEKFRTKPPKEVDTVINDKHAQLFQQIDCLNCANCCKTTSPLLLQNDIQAIAKHLNISPTSLIQQHIIMDEDGDFVFNKTPCPFLAIDNKCSIYAARPKACKEYPHTQQRKQISKLNLSLANTTICPAVYRIFEYLETL